MRIVAVPHRTGGSPFRDYGSGSAGWLRQQAVFCQLRPAWKRHSAEKRADERLDQQSVAKDGGNNERQEESAETKREKRCHCRPPSIPKARYSLVSVTLR